MCEPTTLALATFAISAGSAVSGYMAQQQQADASAAFAEANFQNTKQAAADSYAAINQRQTQEDISAREQADEVNRQLRAAQATASAAAGEAGVSGLSVDALLADYAVGAGRSLTNIRSNRDMTLSQLQAEKSGITSRATSSINEGFSRVTPKPSMLGLGLSLAGGGLNAYSNYMQWSANADMAGGSGAAVPKSSRRAG